MDMDWSGNEQACLDEVRIRSHRHVVCGCYGGSTARGAYKNEDALFVMCDEDSLWTFTVVIDAHKTSESGELIIQWMKENKELLRGVCRSEGAFSQLERTVVDLLSEESFRLRCREVSGEASCLVCFQRGAYLWWLSVGDCIALLLHPELAARKQFALNQRQFYEWIGEANSFELPVACYTTGRRQLRSGSNIVLMMTDGVIETEDRYYEDYGKLYDSFADRGLPLQERVRQALTEVARRQGKDSATIIGWETHTEAQGLQPSDTSS